MNLRARTFLRSSRERTHPAGACPGARAREGGASVEGRAARAFVPFGLGMLCIGLAACNREPPPPPPPPPSAALTGQAPPPPVAPDVAQQPPSANPSGADPISLAAGFTPDPQTATGTAGGAIDASTMSSGCRGYVPAQPNHTLMASSAFASLRILVNGGESDTTLVVQKPDGTFVCDDDSEGRNPIVQIETIPGLHRIWVGAFQQGTTAPYIIGFSEIPGVTTAQLGAPAGDAPSGDAAGRLDTSGERSNFGAITLRPGFQPDPHLTQGTSGGAAGSNINASEIDPRCRGHVTDTPDHVLVASGGFQTLTIAARSEGDTTLVVRAPDGTFLCDDDSGGGRNPMLRGAFPEGTYSIWVGSYQPGTNFPYRLGFSELPAFSSDKL